MSEISLAKQPEIDILFLSRLALFFIHKSYIITVYDFIKVSVDVNKYRNNKLVKGCNER